MQTRGQEAYAARRRKWRENPEARELDKAAMVKWAETNPLSYMLSTARRRAQDKGIEFTIESKDFVVLPTHCPVLGIELHYGRNRGGRQDGSASLDRTDSSKGYVPGNVVIMSWRANDLKGNATLEDLEALVVYMRKGMRQGQF